MILTERPQEDMVRPSVTYKIFRFREILHQFICHTRCTPCQYKLNNTSVDIEVMQIPPSVVAIVMTNKPIQRHIIRYYKNSCFLRY